ncbi:hypothetical protein ACLI4Y_16650 [Natrialbaceae archaeon A-CW3]
MNSYRHAFYKSAQYLLSEAIPNKWMRDKIATNIYTTLFSKGLPDQIYVNPREISLFTGRENASQMVIKDMGVEKGGNWDHREIIKNKFPNRWNPSDSIYYNQSLFHTSLKRRYEENLEWENTEYYKYAKEQTEYSPFWHGCASEECILKRCSEIDRLYYSIKEKGYISRLELYNRGKTKDRTKIQALSNEIVIDIGRNGEPLFIDGKHRLSICKILRIKKVPVIPVVTHEQYSSD